MKNSERKHYKTTTIKGVEYDNRTLLNPEGEHLKMRHCDNVTVFAKPTTNELKEYTGNTVVVMKLPLGKDYSIVFNHPSPSRVVVLEECFKRLKLMPSYKTTAQLKNAEERRKKELAKIPQYSMGVLPPVLNFPKKEKKSRSKQLAA